MKEYKTHINMSPSLMKKGGRNAYQMPLEDFKNLMNEALRPLAVDYDDADFDQLIYEAVSGAHYNEGIPQFAKVAKDLGKISMSYENVITENVFVADNGVPVVQVGIGGDWEAPVRAFLYWDGKAIRGYIPTYGNTFNWYTKCATGSELDCDGCEDVFGKIYHVQSDDPDILKLLPAGVELPKDNPVPVVITEDNYEEFSSEWLKPCDTACLEDFCSRVVAKGPLPKEMFDKSMTAMKKLSDKVIREEEEAYRAEVEEEARAQDMEAKPAKPVVASPVVENKPLWALKPFWNDGTPFVFMKPARDNQPLDFDELRIAMEFRIAATRPVVIHGAKDRDPSPCHVFAYSPTAGDRCGSSKQDWIDGLVKLLNGSTTLTDRFRDIDVCIPEPERDKFLEEYKAAKAAEGKE